ncbi:MAG TPA: chromate transporter [Roseiflexaceae bacterium]|nr:chromate transporter [Roseiflexaceae bacterium]
MIEPFSFFWLLLRASLLSTAGTGNLPLLHQELTAQGLADDRQFAEALAIGQISPGPSGLWVISLGFLIDGPRGALLALVAIALPPLLVLVVAQLYRRAGDHPAMQGFVRGMMLAVVGAFVPVLINLLWSNGPSAAAFLIALVSVGIGMTRRVPIIVHLGLAALAGIMLM